MYAFGLVETNLFEEAEKNALLGLERNKDDGWATHALAHVYEMTGQFDRGISFLDRTSADWTVVIDSYCSQLDVICKVMIHLSLKLN
jgi:hypothetical protein